MAPGDSPLYPGRFLRDLWSHSRRFHIWLEVEPSRRAAPSKTRAWSREGPRRRFVARACSSTLTASTRSSGPSSTTSSRFLTHVRGARGGRGPLAPPRDDVERDVLDTSLAIPLRDAADRPGRLRQIASSSRSRSVRASMRAHPHDRTQPRHLRRAGHVRSGPGPATTPRMARGRARLVQARREVAVGKIAGAVGTYAHLSPEIEKSALGALGLEPETVSTQVGRARPARGLLRGALGAGRGRHRVAGLATNVRHWQRGARSPKRRRRSPRGRSARARARCPTSATPSSART